MGRRVKFGFQKQRYISVPDFLVDCRRGKWSGDVVETRRGRNPEGPGRTRPRKIKSDSLRPREIRAKRQCERAWHAPLDTRQGDITTLASQAGACALRPDPCRAGSQATLRTWSRVCKHTGAARATWRRKLSRFCWSATTRGRAPAGMPSARSRERPRPAPVAKRLAGEIM